MNNNLEFIIILLAICDCIRIIKIDNNDCFSIDCKFISQIKYENTFGLINTNKKLNNQQTLNEITLLLNSLKISDTDIIKNLLTIISENTEKKGWEPIFNFKIRKNSCINYIAKIINQQHIKNLEIVKQIIKNKIMNYFIEQKKLSGLLKFLKYCNRRDDNELSYLNCIIRCIENFISEMQ
jgi:hypothetical protein